MKSTEKSPKTMDPPTQPRRTVTFGFDENGSFLTTRHIYPYEHTTAMTINIVNDTGNINDITHTFHYRVLKVRETLKSIQRNKPTSLPLKIFINKINLLAQISDEEIEHEESLEDIEKEMNEWGFVTDNIVNLTIQDDINCVNKVFIRVKNDKHISSSV